MEFDKVLHKNEWIDIKSIKISTSVRGNKETLFVNNSIKLMLRTKIQYKCSLCGKHVERGFKFNFSDLCQVCKLKETNLTKYGVESNLQLESNKEKTKITSLKRYGTESPNSSQTVKDNKKKVFIEKYGVDNPQKVEAFSNKRKQTCFYKYGTETVLTSNKREQGMLNKYSVKNAMYLKSTKKKIKKTNLKRYGVEHINQHPEFHKKIMSSFGRKMKLKEISENLHYQTQPELECIKFHQNNNIDIWDGPCISYKFENQQHIYHVDFETDKYIIEIKSNHGWYKQNLASGKIDAKNETAEKYAKLIGKEFKFLLDVKSYEGLL